MRAINSPVSSRTSILSSLGAYSFLSLSPTSPVVLILYFLQKLIFHTWASHFPLYPLLLLPLPLPSSFKSSSPMPEPLIRPTLPPISLPLYLHFAPPCLTPFVSFSPLAFCHLVHPSPTLFQRSTPVQSE